ncbi:MAG: tetratricopeptide repeat protein [Armatimonadetes bacterium]|nr:tetratricopeptide repeat protein [Armatimonadota bacterium]
MREQELRKVLSEIGNAERGVAETMSRPEAERLIEDRIPAMLRARYGAEDVRLSDSAKEAGLAALIETAKHSAARDIHLQRDGVMLRAKRIAQSISTGISQAPRRRIVAFGIAFAAALAAVVYFYLSSGSVLTPSREDMAIENPPAPQKGATPPGIREEIAPPEEGLGAPEEPRPRLERPPQEEPLIAERQSEVGTFAAVMGAPTVYALGETEGHAAMPGEVIYTGYRIETGDVDRAEVRLNDGSTLQLNFNTVLEIPAVKSPAAGRGSAQRPSKVRLLSGQVWAKLHPLPPESRFEVETPVATAVALGTEFGLLLRRIQPESQKPKTENGLEAVLTVRSGRVAFFNEFGRVEATEMTESVATAKSAPTEPKRLSSLKDYTVYHGSNRTLFWENTYRLGGHDAAQRYVFQRGWAGLTVATLPGGEVRIVSVSHDSPAQGAGLRVGDVIVSMDGEPVMTASSARRTIYRGPGRRIAFTIDRNGEMIEASMVTVLGDPPPPSVPSRLADRLNEATRPAMSGDTDSSLRMLRELAANLPHAAVYNNLGVVYETRDEMGSAIRNYQAAVRLDTQVSLYHYNLGLALQKIGNFERSVEELQYTVQLDYGFHAAPLKLAFAYTLLNRFDDALTVLEVARARFPSCTHVWITMSRVLEKSGRFEEAREAVATAIVMDPDSAQAHRQLGSILSVEHRFDEAEAALRKAIDLSPAGPSQHNNLGNVLVDVGRLEDAEAEYRKAIELDPDSPAFYINLGILLTDTGRPEEAETAYQRAIALDPDYAPPYNGLGILLERAGRYEEAEAMARKAIELNPDYPSAHRSLGYILKKMGRLKDAETAFRRAIELEPDDAVARQSLGVLLSRAGRLPEAEAMYRKAIELDPTYALPYSNLGELLRLQRRLVEAEAVLREAIELDPNNWATHNSLGIVLARTGRSEEGEAAFRAAIQLDPKRAQVHTNLGLHLMNSGRLVQAEALFRKGIELEPKLTFSYRSLLFLLAEQGRLTEVEDVYRQWLAALPDDLSAINELAWFLAGQGKSLNEALALARRAVEADPENPDIADTLGWVHFKRGEWAEAEIALRKAVELFGVNPGAAGSLVRLGQVYEAQGDREAAKDAYRKALKIDPEHEEAQEALKRLGGDGVDEIAGQRGILERLALRTG